MLWPTETIGRDGPYNTFYNGSEETSLENYNMTPVFVPWKYPSARVIAHTKSQGVAWLDGEKLEMLTDRYVYVADDPAAPLHPPANKGNKAMVYLTCIVDHYDDLRDVSLFMHAHRFSGHNNVFLDEDAAKMFNHLNPERIMRDGYMNQRCQSGPGCPAWVHPAQGEKGSNGLDPVIAKVWGQLFPGERTPEVLAQTCCAQFAVTRERIRETPLSKY